MGVRGGLEGAQLEPKPTLLAHYCRSVLVESSPLHRAQARQCEPRFFVVLFHCQRVDDGRSHLHVHLMRLQKMPVANIASIPCMMLHAGGTSHVYPPTSNTSWSTSAAQPVASPNDRQQSTARTGCDCGVDTSTPGQRTIQFLENAQLPLSHRRSPIVVPSAACQA